jgi:phosphoesterase RecJ-like protein
MSYVDLSTIVRGVPVFVTTHMNPDGDAIGSAVSMYHLLKHKGHDARGVVLETDPEPHYQPLLYDTPIFTPATLSLPQDYIGLLVDAHLPERAGTVAQVLNVHIAIDHHPQKDTPIPSVYIDEHAPSCSFIIARLALHERVHLSHPAPYSIFTPAYYGLVTDTLSFSPAIERTKLIRAFDAAREMIDYVDLRRIREAQPALTLDELNDIGWLYRNINHYANGIYTLYIDEPHPTFKKALEAMRSLRDYRYAIVGVYDGTTLRVSIRSAPDAKAIHTVMEKYGGGGHPHAAGCLIKTDMPRTLFNAIVHEVYRLAMKE